MLYGMNCEADLLVWNPPTAGFALTRFVHLLALAYTHRGTYKDL